MSEQTWTPEAALSRYLNAAHRRGGDMPRMSIPARPDHDDDLLLFAWIKRARAIEEQLRETTAALRCIRDGSPFRFSGSGDGIIADSESALALPGAQR